jgi:hypothetical protein
MALFLFTVFVSWQSLFNGLLIIFWEVVLGSMGWLFVVNLFSISLRQALFAAIMLVAIIKLFNKNNCSKVLANYKKIKNYFWLIFLFITCPLIVGLLKNDLTYVFFDANAWFYYGLILPILLIDWSASNFIKFLKIFIGANLATILLTIIIYVFYGWGLMSLPQLSWLYYWLRQVGWGEVTHVTGNLYRIFSQSQIMILFLWSLSLFWYIKNYKNIFKKATLELLIFLSTTTLIINLSRSMWLGGFAIIIFLCVKYKEQIKAIWKRLIIIFAIAVLITGLLVGRVGFISVFDRLAQQPSEPAFSSRLTQISPLLNAIKAHWLLGSGFGAKIGYSTSDPRAQSHLDANGLYWTYAFELGYLDQLFKMGLLVFILFIVFICKLINKLRKSNNTNAFSLLVILLSALITHIFSPYINHPLGIVIILSILVFLIYEPTFDNQFADV